MNEHLARVAEAEALKFYHGNVMGSPTNLHPIAELFPMSETWTIDNWDNCWCAAFVYWCCKQAGHDLPVRYPHEQVKFSFAACPAWEQWARLPEVDCWVGREETPQTGDIVLLDRVFDGNAPDHIAIVIGANERAIITAEGNFNNVSAVVERPYDNVRGYVRV